MEGITQETLQALTNYMTKKLKACPYQQMMECWGEDCQVWNSKTKDCGLKTQTYIKVDKGI